MERVLELQKMSPNGEKGDVSLDKTPALTVIVITRTAFWSTQSNHCWSLCFIKGGEITWKKYSDFRKSLQRTTKRPSRKHQLSQHWLQLLQLSGQHRAIIADHDVSSKKGGEITWKKYSDSKKSLQKTTKRPSRKHQLSQHWLQLLQLSGRHRAITVDYIVHDSDL